MIFFYISGNTSVIKLVYTVRIIIYAWYYISRWWYYNFIKL